LTSIGSKKAVRGPFPRPEVEKSQLGEEEEPFIIVAVALPYLYSGNAERNEVPSHNSTCIQ